MTTLAQLESNSKRTTDAGATLTLSGRINDKGVGLGLSLDIKHKNDKVIDSTVKETTIVAGKNVSLKGKDIVHQGTHISGATINESADQIRHQAAQGGINGSTVDAAVHAGIDVNLGYDKALAVKAGIGASGGRKDSKNMVAQGTRLDASVVNITAGDSLVDKGTIYNGKDQVNLNAGNLVLESAFNENGSVDNRGGASVGINASTQDFNTVNVSLDVAANFQHEKENSAKAVKTQINSASVNANARDLLFSEADVHSTGTVNMSAGKDLILSQANDIDTKRGGGFNAKLGVGGLIIPAAGAAVPSIDVALSVNGHDSHKQTAVASGIHAKELNLGSQGNTHIQGTNIDVGTLNAKGEKVVLTGLEDQGKSVGVAVGVTSVSAPMSAA